jgi:hypothetical protein
LVNIYFHGHETISKFVKLVKYKIEWVVFNSRMDKST